MFHATIAAKREWRGDVGRDQDRPSRPQQDHAGVDQVAHFARSVPGPDDDEIGHSGFR